MMKVEDHFNAARETRVSLFLLVAHCWAKAGELVNAACWWERANAERLGITQRNIFPIPVETRPAGAIRRA
jgi:hypothetical protein